MKKSLFCVFLTGMALFLFIQKQNALTRLRVEIPQLNKELKIIREENRRLQFQIAQFENPALLLKLLEKKEFEYLRFPTEEEIVVIKR